MTEVLTFEAALGLAGDAKPRLLLGNGFSIGYDPGSFSYGRLLDAADFSALSIDVRDVFAAFGTTDFERIIEVLRTAAVLLGYYSGHDPALAAQIGQDADRLKDALAKVLAARHPDTVGSITDDEYRHVRTFLGRFDRIYTLNYDLLLYWATMKEGVGPRVINDDGFRNSDIDPDADWVAWDPTAVFRSQRVFYLHRALHLFDAGHELRKNTWVRTGVPIVEQTRDALDQNLYPLVVTEGSSEEKYARILHSGYLLHGYRSLSSIGGTLFIHGHSLAKNDEHILRLIEDGEIATVFISLHGDPGEAGNVTVIARGHRLAINRGEGPPLAVHFYDAASAHVWRT